LYKIEHIKNTINPQKMLEINNTLKALM